MYIAVRGQSECDFDSGPCDYIQESTGLQWQIVGGVDSQRIPSRDATSGSGDFAYVDSSSQVRILISLHRFSNKYDNNKFVLGLCFKQEISSHSFGTTGKGILCCGTTAFTSDFTNSIFKDVAHFLSQQRLM